MLSLVGVAGSGQLKYNWSNVCMHYFSRDFLEAASRRLEAEGRYHIARKKIPSTDGPVQVPYALHTCLTHKRLPRDKDFIQRLRMTV